LNPEKPEPSKTIDSLLSQSDILYYKRHRKGLDMLFKLFIFNSGMIPAFRIIAWKSRNVELRQRATSIFVRSAPSIQDKETHLRLLKARENVMKEV